MLSAFEGDETDELIARSLNDDPIAFEGLHARYRPRLRSVVEKILMDMDSRMAARIDASDIMQEVFLKASKRLREFSEQRRTTFFVWLKGLAEDSLKDANRFHVRSQRRSVRRERNCGKADSEDSIRQLADKLCDSGFSPSQQAMRAEAKDQLRECLTKLSFADRQVLVLRFLEGLSLQEIASILNVSQNLVSKRQVRAYRKLLSLIKQDEKGS